MPTRELLDIDVGLMFLPLARPMRPSSFSLLNWRLDFQAQKSSAGQATKAASYSTNPVENQGLWRIHIEKLG